MVPRYGWTGLSPITKVTTSASCWAAMHKQSACSWWSLMVSGGVCSPHPSPLHASLGLCCSHAGCYTSLQPSGILGELISDFL